MTEIKMRLSKKRVLISAIISFTFVFYTFNFVPRNINILETRSLPRLIFAYGSNFVLFFVVSYLVLALIAHLIPHSKSAK